MNDMKEKVKRFVCWIFRQPREWHQNGKRHRDNGPAVIWASGTQVWYQNGQLHRDDAPAIIYTDGHQAWYQNGKKHRDDGPAVVYPSGDKVWYQNGKLHRDNAPAIIWADGDEFWYHHDVGLSETEIQKIKDGLEADSWIRDMLTTTQERI